ncbi:histidine ammonia-lyase [Deferribacter autotrophicus]|uniref:Histidine ammonia-lyase n=1 Tax=Deferribacter autotrophicus TaxID=500465 RepID=A0A5A8F165_9BACT|nr:histidine ammonia-lyase [Deferribacter autotrophicus]KAA0257019.1 histidine ammonia-lyase [Deferribacter autotrophicus]
MKKFLLGKDKISPKLIIEILNKERECIIDEDSAEKIKASYLATKKAAESDLPIYGVNTGFGSLCSTKISTKDTTLLQYNLLKSHSAGVGENLPDDIVKIMLILKAHSLSFGYSGVNIETIKRILWFVENDVMPVVPSQGSVGASGDLAPLAHLFLPLIGYGQVRYNGKVFETAEIYQKFGIDPIKLGPKEGLALINGTQFMAAFGVKSLIRMKNILDNADIIGAMTLESLMGSVKPFDERLHRLREYKGCLFVAHRFRELLKGSEILRAHENCDRVQDPYSLRCIPQVHGASRNAFLHLKEILMTEINSVTDNPIIFSHDDIISGGNFHGQPIALPMDYAAFAVSEIGNISDRRTYLLLEGRVGLPKFLMKDTGINSGFMIPQYTSAALVTENKTLCFPASADSVPTSLGQEDHVSMGSVSCRKLDKILDNLENILAVELVCAAQAFDFRRPLKSSVILEACYQVVREKIDHADEDRVFAKDLKVAAEIIKSGEMVTASEDVAVKSGIDLNGGYDELFGLY